MIPEATLNQIQDRIDIVEAIGALVPLRRAGRSFKACCPFHHEKTPSFVVNPDKQIFHCFGCQAGGNIFTFLMKFEKKDFREVVEALAERTGVEIPQDRTVNTAAVERTAQIVSANTLAAEFYMKTLAADREADAARAYLKKRGLGATMIERFKLGFAPAGWDALYKKLKGPLTDEVLERSGLILPRKEGGGFYDRFRNRIMFPILDAKGVCVGLGGRVMDDSVPKYLNSPETEVYSKGRMLYGVYEGRKAIRDKDAVLIVEGYMDLIGCHQAGVENVVASLGTALTHDQARLIKRHTKNVFILYDADKAGEAATLRGLEIFVEEGMEVKIVRLPAGHDPDSYAKEFGAEKFKEALAGAKTLFDYRVALLKKQFNPDTVEGKVAIANQMVSLFAKAQNEILRAAWVKELASELEISEQALLAEMGKTKSAAPARAAAQAERKFEPARPSVVPGVEQLLIGLMLEDREFIVKTRGSVSAEAFTHPAAERVVKKLFEMEQARTEVTAAGLVNQVGEDAEAREVVSAASAAADTIVDPERTFEDCIAGLKRSKLQNTQAGLQAELVTAQREGDAGRIGKILMELNELNKGMKKINEKK